MQSICIIEINVENGSGKRVSKLFSICKNITIGSEWVLLYTNPKISPTIKAYTICIGCIWANPNNNADIIIGKAPPLYLAASLKIIPLKIIS